MALRDVSWLGQPFEICLGHSHLAKAILKLA